MGCPSLLMLKHCEAAGLVRGQMSGGFGRELFHIPVRGVQSGQKPTLFVATVLFGLCRTQAENWRTLID